MGLGSDWKNFKMKKQKKPAFGPAHNPNLIVVIFCYVAVLHAERVKFVTYGNVVTLKIAWLWKKWAMNNKHSIIRKPSSKQQAINSVKNQSHAIFKVMMFQILPSPHGEYNNNMESLFSKVALSKRDSNTVVFLWILRNF